MIPHSIRLRQPWDELPASIPGRAIFRRRFNSPTGLDTWERVVLEVDRTIFSGQLSINGTPIGQLQSGQLFSADITELLQTSNEVRAEVDCHSAAEPPPASASIYIVDHNEPLGSPIGDVRLVIRSALSNIE
jgi:hypothetical protein